MSSFGLCGCMHMCQHVDIHSHERVYMYSPPTHTHTQQGRRQTGDNQRCGHVCCVWGSMELFLSFYFMWLLGTQTQVARLVWQSPFAYLPTMQALFSFLVESHQVAQAGHKLRVLLPQPNSPGIADVSASLTGIFSVQESVYRQTHTHRHTHTDTQPCLIQQRYTPRLLTSI